MRSPSLLALFLSLALSGPVSAQTVCRETGSRGAPGDQLGCSVATNGEISAFGANMGNGGRGAVTVEAFSQPVVPADAALGDQFGFASAFFNDILIVGAPTADVQGRRDAGAVYVFRLDGGQWVQEAKITATDAVAGAQLGFSLAFDGEVLAVGAPRDSARGSLSGAVYLFEEARSGEWVQIAKLTAGLTKPFDEFGYAVALSNDTLAVGAPFADGRAGGNQGAVYLFERRSGVWTERYTPAASSAAAGDEFGGAVALDGGTLAVGARRADAGGTVDAGAVYVFEAAGGPWRERARLTAPGGGARDRFGGAVALDGGRLVAGAAMARGGTGLAYVFEEDEAGAWRFRETLTPPVGGSFGFSIALSVNSVVVGAFMARGGAGSATECNLDPNPAANLGLTLDVPESARPGGQITHTLTVTNNGPATAIGVVLMEEIPAGLQPVVASLPKGCAVQPGKISCQLGNLAPGVSVVNIEWMVLSSCVAEIENAAMVDAENASPESVEPPPTALLLTADLAVTNTAPASARRGDAILYALAVTNNGPHCARGVVLNNTIPTGLASPSLPSDCGLSAGEIRCSLGNLLPLEERNLALSFSLASSVATEGTIDNTATVRTRSADPNPENSSATTRTSIVTSGASEIPALSMPGLLALAVLLAALALLRLRRRSAP